MKPTETLLQEFREKLKVLLPCIQSGCDNNGVIATAHSVARQVGDEEFVEDVEWEQEQCQYCDQVRFPIIDAVLETISSTRAERDGEFKELVEDALKFAQDVIDNDKTPKYEYSRSPRDANAKGKFTEEAGARWSMPREMAQYFLNRNGKYRALLEPTGEEDKEKSV